MVKKSTSAARRQRSRSSAAARASDVAADPALGVGEAWFVKLPGAMQCACVEVDELTARTVVLRLTDELGTMHHGRVGRYERRDVRFVERVPR